MALKVFMLDKIPIIQSVRVRGVQLDNGCIPFVFTFSRIALFSKRRLKVLNV